MSKLTSIQTELKVPKRHKLITPKFTHEYRTTDDILECVKPLLTKYECSLTISDSIIERGGRCYVESTVIFNDGQKITLVTASAREPLSNGGMNEAQITGSSSTYARRYALNGLFLLDDIVDPDSQMIFDGKKETPIVTEKPWLVKGTPAWDKAVQWIKDGKSIKTIEKKYQISQSDTILILNHLIK